VLAYRLAKRKYINDLSGGGARFAGGRWNEKGTDAIYAASNRALALAEFLVHIPIGLIPRDIMLAVIKIPDDCPKKSIKLSDLPNTWKDYPPPFKLAKIGTKWLKENSELVLRIPSAIVSDEWNLLINPHHPDIHRVQISEVDMFCLDQRLFREAHQDS